MKKILIATPFLLVSLLYLFSSFQKKPGIAELSEKIISLMEVYVDEIPEEKVFLHLDRSLYASGDNIWFSVFLTAGSPDIPSPLSKVVYVDLLDEEGKLIQQKTIKMEEGHGFGDFRLDAFTREGSYKVKAYSYWLKGFGEEAVFQTDIQILDTYNLKFQPFVEFEKEEKGNKTHYVAKITALDNSLKALAGEDVEFKIANRKKELNSGNFQLNGEGKYELEFELESGDLNLPVALNLNLVENEDYSISRKFILPFPNSSIDIQFLPEGGDLISGFNNKVAVRAIYPDGKPVQLKGKIDYQGQEIEFSTNSSGLAAFNITPQDTEPIKVVLESGASIFEKSLDGIKTQGVNLAVDTSKETLVNVLIQTKDFPSISPSGEALLVVHARGRIGHMQVLNLSNGVGGARINKSQLAPGINQLTIFEPEGTPLAERMVYIPMEKELSLDLNAATVNTEARGKNSWMVNINGDSFEGGFYSVAVVDAGESPFSHNSSINSYLKLESELKGNIHEPKLLLGQSRDNEAIELIMLTHGWKRFNWEGVFEGKIENTHFIEQGINITGIITPQSDRRRGLTGGMLNVFSKGRSEDFLAVEFGENGKFIIDDLDFQDTTQLTIAANDNRHKEFVKLELDPPLSKYAQWEGFEPIFKDFKISDAMRDYLATAEKRRLSEAAYGHVKEVDIEEFIIESKRIDPSTENINRMFGAGDVSVKPEDIGGFEGFRDVFELLQGRFAGVRVIPSLSGPPVLRIRGQGSIQAGGTPLILLDNVPIDVGFASSISPRELASIEIFKDAASAAIFGSSGGNGAIALYTKRGAGMVDTGEGVFSFRFPGYSVASEYYMPKYDVEISPAPDYRSTLYWNPKLEWLDNSAMIEFFNNDIVKKYRVVIQGMDKYGRLSYLEKDI